MPVDACKSTPRSGPSSRTSTQPAHNPESPPTLSSPSSSTKNKNSTHSLESLHPTMHLPLPLPSPLLFLSSLTLPYPISLFSLFPLFLSILPSHSISLPFLPAYPPPLPTPTNFLTYPEPVPPSLPRSIEIGKTLQRQALPERTGTVDIMAWHLLVTGSARPGWGWVEYITVVIIKRRRKVNLCGTLE